MSEEDLKLLQAVRDWRPPQQLHPIAMVAWQLYEDGGFKLSDEALAKLRAILDDYGDDLKSLAEAIEGCTRFLILLSEHQKDQDAATKVAELLRSYMPRFEPFWAKVGEALANVGADQKGSFLSFVDQDRSSEKVAPVEGTPPPEGTVPLRNIAPPPRPPPWMKKGSK
jgi:hypothetical protein